MVIKNMLKDKSCVRLAVAVLLITVSCKKKETIDTKNSGFKPEKQAIEYKVEFPDTVYLSQKYNGVIQYKSILDTITTSFEDKKKNRYTFLALTLTKRPYNDFLSLKKAVRDTFGAINNREIPFYNINFNSTGIFYIEGIINDYVRIDTNKKNKDGLGIAREIEKEKWITHKVVVINRPK